MEYDITEAKTICEECEGEVVLTKICQCKRCLKILCSVCMGQFEYCKKCIMEMTINGILSSGIEINGTTFKY